MKKKSLFFHIHRPDESSVQDSAALAQTRMSNSPFLLILHLAKQGLFATELIISSLLIIYIYLNILNKFNMTMQNVLSCFTVQLEGKTVSGTM